MTERNIFARLQDEIASREKEEAGLAPADLLALPDDLRALMTKITRLGEATASQLALELGQEEVEVEGMLAELVEKGYLREEKRYKVAFGRKRIKKLPFTIWEALDQKISE
jgi:predicted ArsR family transcriptional regulator